MAHSSKASRSIAAALRAFLAEARFGDVTETRWISFQQEVEIAVRNGNFSQDVQSCLIALKRYQASISPSQWKEYMANFEAELIDKEESALLNFLWEDILHETKDRDGGNSGKRNLSDLDSNALKKKPRLKNDRSIESDSKEITDRMRPFRRYLGFYLLRTRSICNPGSDLGLDEVVLPGAELAVVCNFKFDMKWMWENAASLQTCQKVLIMHGEGPEFERESKKFLRRERASERVQFVRPETPPYGTVHTKMFILFYASGCRVCIHTANMIAEDWDFKTQGAYLRDFPLITESESCRSREDVDDFKLHLSTYFRKALPNSHYGNVANHIDRYDFSSAGVAFVSSTPGSHTGAEKEMFGHARLRRLLSKLISATPSKDSIAVCQFSSLGSIRPQWLENEFCSTLFASSNVDLTGSRRDIKLVYPTLQQVQQSNEGLAAGGALPVQPKNLNREHILRRLHKWDASPSGREQAMPHIKTFMRYEEGSPSKPLWIFLGSFNLSVAAWGRMQGARKRKSWDRLLILSYEVGVLFAPRLACPPRFSLGGVVKYSPSPVYEKLWDSARTENTIQLQIYESKTCIETTSEDVLQVMLPLPHKNPPPQYSGEDTPWNTNYCAMA